MGAFCSVPEVPEIDVEAPEIDMKKAAEAVKDSMGEIEKATDKYAKEMKYPFTLHEKNVAEKQKITEVPDAEKEWAKNIHEYLAACDEKVMKKVSDNVWDTVVVPSVEPQLDKSIDDATGNVEGWENLPGMIQRKAKSTAKEKALEQAREKSKFDERMQVKAFSILVERMTKNGATIDADYKPTEVGA